MYLSNRACATSLSRVLVARKLRHADLPLDPTRTANLTLSLSFQASWSGLELQHSRTTLVHRAMRLRMASIVSDVGSMSVRSQPIHRQYLRDRCV